MKTLLAIVSGFVFLSTTFIDEKVASAATWAPTNEDTDFIVLDFGKIDLNGATLALFDIAIPISSTRW